jgi:hypothetical protein
MKIVQQRDKLLSNFEVYQHLCDVQKENEWGFTIPQTQKRRKNKFNPQLLDLEIITRDLSQYLTKNEQGNDVKTETFVNLMVFLNSLDLEIIEKLMIVNLLPRSLVNLYAIIEECEDRLSQEQCESILENIENFFPSPVEEADEDVDMDIQNEEEVEEENGDNEEDEEDIEQFVQDDELEHEGLVKKKNDDKEIDEAEA